MEREATHGNDRLEPPSRQSETYDSSWLLRGVDSSVQTSFLGAAPKGWLITGPATQAVLGLSNPEGRRLCVLIFDEWLCLTGGNMLPMSAHAIS